MTLELDHIFILTQRDAPAAQALIELNLNEGSTNEHPGQGTANRRFFFANVMLELLFVTDTALAETGINHQLGLNRRASNPTACPFGIVVRNTSPKFEEPFASWRYQPSYLPAESYFCIGENSNNLFEPLLICMPSALEKKTHAPKQCNPGLSATRMSINLPVSKPSSLLRDFDCQPEIIFEYAKPYLLEMSFSSDNKNRCTYDLRPALPLRIEF